MADETPVQPIPDNSAFFEQEIASRVQELHTLCKEHGLPFFVTFQTTPANEEGTINMITSAWVPFNATDTFELLRMIVTQDIGKLAQSLLPVLFDGAIVIDMCQGNQSSGNDKEI